VKGWSRGANASVGRDEIMCTPMESANKFKPVRRKPLSLSQERLVETGALAGAAKPFPLLMSPAVEGVHLARWAAQNRPLLEQELQRCGAILFRGFGVEGVEGFEEVARAVSSRLLDYRERSSPRSELARGVYTSTDYPADQAIHFHNEQSYTHSWPMKLYFFCVRPADSGGATPIADGRHVLNLLDARLRDEFLRKRVMYVRNYGDGMGLTWQDAFQTTSKTTVEEYCRRVSIDFEWKDGERLRTRQVFDTIVTHPKTREEVWFEHAAFFHISNLAPDVRQALTAEFDEEDLPFNTYYGDGSAIKETSLAQIREAYAQTATRFDWQEGDILLIDNMLTAHSREPFNGPRKIAVAMAELYPPEHP
jgi:alpha-ketoglutarate-dependent taurine dioxygenase